MKPQRLHTDSAQTLLLEARCLRRQRKLDAVEIPERYVTVTNELLGKGGFGSVYMADYNGRNAAAKVGRRTFFESHTGFNDMAAAARKPPPPRPTNIAVQIYRNVAVTHNLSRNAIVLALGVVDLGVFILVAYCLPS